LTLIELKPRVILDKFNEHCNKLKGWQIYENEDLVQVKESFHKIFWIHDLHPETFKSVVLDRSYTIQSSQRFFEPFDYVESYASKKCPSRTVRVSFMGFVASQHPSAEIVVFLERKPQIKKRVALYDISRFFESQPVCLKLNKTKSRVFNEFERFLTCNYGAEFEEIILREH
jgi:hypothetical protein